MGATHGIETGPLLGACDFDEASRRFYGTGEAADRFGRILQDAWTGFARTGERVDAPLEAERQAWEHVPDEAIGY